MMRSNNGVSSAPPTLQVSQRLVISEFDSLTSVCCLIAFKISPIEMLYLI